MKNNLITILFIFLFAVSMITAMIPVMDVFGEPNKDISILAGHSFKYYVLDVCIFITSFLSAFFSLNKIQKSFPNI